MLKLAVTEIGDLLINEKISHDEKWKPIEHVCLEIPDYQRPYKWTVRNAIQLLDDIIEAKNANKDVYRVGTLILHKRSDGKYDVVDGQQRTTTFALLLHALNGALEREQNIPFLNQEVYANPSNRHNLPNNYRAFARRFKAAEDKGKSGNRPWELKELKDFIENRCELIVVITDDVSEAFQFFDSQNARGKSLYPHDLLKAYHLREMTNVDPAKTEAIVSDWEKKPQGELAEFFGDYIYRVKEWVNGNGAFGLNEHNIDKFKGITRNANTPYAQFYKSAYAYSCMVNSSAMPFVSGTRDVNGFQLNTPIIAGMPFFDFTRHYYEILRDVRDNSKFEGFYVKGNAIVQCLDDNFNKGTGNRVARLLFDTALLLYVDKFCPVSYPTASDTELFEQFLVYAFVWAYSLRAQYANLGWQSAQNYILERGERKERKKNSLNIYKEISQADHAVGLLSKMADRLLPLNSTDVKHEVAKDNGTEDNSYLCFFAKNGYYK